MIGHLCTLICGSITAAVLALLATDPAAALRDAYKPVLDNAWVRVERVHYAPNVKLPSHPHTEFAAAYIYLNDSGPVVFRHHGVDYSAATRAATKAGMFRLYRAVKEMHEVENTSASPSDFFRVEFKTDAPQSALLRGRYERLPAARTSQSLVQFENVQLRVTRIALVNDVFKIDHNAPFPSVLLDTRQGTLRWIGKGDDYAIEHRSGEASDILRFELKTEPQSSAVNQSHN
jgi:hypothetical protein